MWVGLLTDRINNKLEKHNLINEHALNSEPVPLSNDDDHNGDENGKKRNRFRFLVCNHVTRRHVGGQNKRLFPRRIYMNIEFSSQRREMILFLTTNMAAVTSRANHQLAKQKPWTCITLFCPFLSRRCTTTTWKCLISRFFEDGNTRRQLCFSFLQLWWSPSEFKSKNVANIWGIKRDGTSAIKFEAARIHCLNDVFVVVAVLVA